MEINKIYHGNNIELLKKLDNNCIDLTITSPPYDNLREYENKSLWNFDVFTQIADELYRVTKNGGVVVWIVNDATINGSETGTSFKQVLYFKEIGFNLHDTMIYQKKGIRFPEANRYYPIFEYMFILSKNKPKTFNPIKDRKNKYINKKGKFIFERQKNGKIKVRKKTKNTELFGMRYNIWEYSIGYMNSTPDKIAYNHPAVFPEKLAYDHIISWSNENDLILDPFMGSGTVAKMAIVAKRNYIGFEINQNYIDICQQRIKDYTDQLKLF